MKSCIQWELYGIIYALCRKVSFDLQTLTNTYWFKRGARLMLASRSEGLRIAQYVETSNAESPTQMYDCAQPPCP